MAKYKCPGCAKASEKTGICSKCKKAFEKQCQLCGAEIHKCMCRSDIPQTKGHAPR